MEAVGLRPLLTAKQARRLLGGISKSTLWRLVRQGDLPVVRIGRRTFFRPEDVENLVARKLRLLSE